MSNFDFGFAENKVAILEISHAFLAGMSQFHENKSLFVNEMKEEIVKGLDNAIERKELTNEVREAAREAFTKDPDRKGAVPNNLDRMVVGAWNDSFLEVRDLQGEIAMSDQAIRVLDPDGSENKAMTALAQLMLATIVDKMKTALYETHAVLVRQEISQVLGR